MRFEHVGMQRPVVVTLTSTAVMLVSVMEYDAEGAAGRLGGDSGR